MAKDQNARYRSGWELKIRAFIPFDPHEPETMKAAVEELNGVRPALQAALKQGTVVYVKREYREMYKMPDEAAPDGQSDDTAAGAAT